MEGISSSLEVSCVGSSRIGSTIVGPEKMNAESCLPSSIRAALSFVSGHCTVEPRQFFHSCTGDTAYLPARLETGSNLHGSGAKENPIVIEDEQEEDAIPDMPVGAEMCLDSFSFEDKSRNYIQKQNSYVYKRRKLQGNSVTLLPKQTQIASGRECLPNDGVNSGWLSQAAQVENFPACHDDISAYAGPYRSCSKNFLQSGKKVISSNSNGFSEGVNDETSAGLHVDYKTPDSEGISSYNTESSKSLLDAGKTHLNVVDTGEASSGSRSVIEDRTSIQVQSSSSSEMSEFNLGHNSVSVKHDLTDLVECTSSADVTYLSRETDTEKEWCISVLKEFGLLGWFVPSREAAAAGHPGVVGDGSLPQLCKICGSLEDSTRTLICDICDDIFHMSCCNPKVKSVPAQDYWYCQFCRKKRKRPGNKCLIESKKPQRITKETCTNSDKSAQDKADLFIHMLEDNEPYTTQVRIGKAFQADVPEWTGKVTDDAEMLFLGEPLGKEFTEQNLLNQELWSKVCQPAQPFYPGLMENWLQCRNVIGVDGACLDGQKAKEAICGKWRRAPLSEVQNDGWDCSCVVVWDPAHADCAVPQELETEEVLRRVKANDMAKQQIVYKKRKSKTKHCIGGENRDRVEGPIHR